MSNSFWGERDQRLIWHPCTQMHDHESFPILPIKKARGIWLEDFEGHRYLDAISSWWVNIFGHAHPELNAALSTQAEQLAHIMLAGFSHQPIIELSAMLVDRAPKGLVRCFYADNGASAIEVALKMSMHAWRHQGMPGKNRFVALSNSYHGETLGALSVTDIPLFSATYAPLLTTPLRVPSPDCSHLPVDQWQQHSQASLLAVELLFQKRHTEIAAMIVEPLVQGAAGMRMYHPAYLSGLRSLCNQYQVHLIADEIAVGFGRTGTFFACEQASITPDFLCLSKALTAGYLPMSVVLTTDFIYQLFYGAYEQQKGFMHSHSYTGNALAAAVAVASLKLFDRDQVLCQNQQKSVWMQEMAENLLPKEQIRHLRRCGMILAFDWIPAPGQVWDPESRAGLALHRAALQHGILIRPIGHQVYIMPPYIITEEELEVLFRGISKAMHHAYPHLRVATSPPYTSTDDWDLA